MSQWTVPTGPPREGRPIRGIRVFVGIVLAIVGHLLTIGLGFLALTGNPSFWLAAGGIGQGVLFVVCLVLGIVFIVKADRGLGLGLLIGWGVGVIVLPVVGFGICIVLLNTLETT